MLTNLQSITSSNLQQHRANFPSREKSRSGSIHSSIGTTSDDQDSMKQSRHARRLYIGSIPQNYASEELLTRFLNYAISLGLNEDPETSNYILSVYMNPKKYFAFVELNSVELTTACLEIDGILFYGNALKIQRADEYKPDLLSHTYKPQPLRLDLTKIPFFHNLEPTISPMETSLAQLSTIIQDGTNKIVEPGSLAILGHPYDENIRLSNTPTTRAGCGGGPKAMRKWMRKIGSISNPETDSDLSHLTIIDKGDTPGGLNYKESQSRLVEAITGIIYQGSIPILVGGTNDLSYCCASSLMAVAGGNIAVLTIDACLNAESVLLPDQRTAVDGCMRRLLDDRRFCPPRDGLGSMPSCDGRFVAFGAQGMLSSTEGSRYITDRGGSIVWLGKHIRTRSATGSFSAGEQFKQVLTRLGENTSQYLAGSRRPVCVCFHLRAINGVACPGVSSPSTVGLTVDEVFDMCFVAGTNHNVALIGISDFNPDVEESQTGRLVAGMIQQFLLGVTRRYTGNSPASTGANTTPGSSGSVPSSTGSNSNANPELGGQYQGHNTGGVVAPSLNRRVSPSAVMAMPPLMAATSNAVMSSNTSSATALAMSKVMSASSTMSGQVSSLSNSVGAMSFMDSQSQTRMNTLSSAATTSAGTTSSTGGVGVMSGMGSVSLNSNMSRQTSNSFLVGSSGSPQLHSLQSQSQSYSQTMPSLSTAGVNGVNGSGGGGNGSHDGHEMQSSMFMPTSMSMNSSMALSMSTYGNVSISSNSNAMTMTSMTNGIHRAGNGDLELELDLGGNSHRSHDASDTDHGGLGMDVKEGDLSLTDMQNEFLALGTMSNNSSGLLDGDGNDLLDRTVPF